MHGRFSNFSQKYIFEETFKEKKYEAIQEKNRKMIEIKKKEREKKTVLYNLQKFSYIWNENVDKRIEVCAEKYTQRERGPNL